MARPCSTHRLVCRLYPWVLIGLSSMAHARDTAEVASRFLHALIVEADLPRAYREWAVPDFIEHNPSIGNGYAAKMRYFAERQAQDPTFPPPAAWANVVDNEIIDEDLFAVQRHVFTHVGDRGRVFVDIWRVADGKIVEHWDVIQAVPENVSNQNTMWCSKGSDYASAKALTDTVTTPTCGVVDRNANSAASRAVVQEYARLLSQGKITRAVEHFHGSHYIEHSPHIADGSPTLTAYLSKELRNPHAKPTVTIGRVIAHGNLVLVHRHVTLPNDPRGSVAIDLFRIAGGRIIEHWDVKEAVPPTSANDNTMW
jgi:predicted SnoaL-like aldol condensation-catalyzing enzyme